MMNISIVLFTLFSLIIPMVKSQNWILDYLLPPDYNRDVMPINNADQKSLQVNVTLYINLFRGTDNELVNFFIRLFPPYGCKLLTRF